MLTSEPTLEMVEKWKRIYRENCDRLNANRRSGEEVNGYFCRNYRYEKLDCPTFRETVKYNILENEPSREKLPKGAVPQIATYRLLDEDVIVGIDLITGFFQVEGEEINRVAEIYDDLFVFRGLDERDVKNCFLVAQYVECLNKKP